MKRKKPENVVQEQDDGSGDDNRNITVVIESAVLDCPVCFEPFELPLLQCINGHTICSYCCNKVDSACPICSLSISRIRCLPFESIIESNRITCPYSVFGCIVPITYAQGLAHKESCRYAPCSCPIPACRFRGKEMGLTFHIVSEHKSFEQLIFISYGTSVTVSLQREQPFFIVMKYSYHSFLLLNSHGPHGIDSGNELSVVRIRPGPASCDFQYELEVGGDMGKKLRLDASPENVSKWTKDYRSKFFLYVPDDFIGSSGVINVKVSIKRLSFGA